jgi:PAS domain S-box-containing protein
MKEQLGEVERCREIYKLLFEDLNEASIIVNLNKTIIDCNNSASEIFKSPKEKIVGLDIGGFLSPFIFSKEVKDILFNKSLSEDLSQPFHITVNYNKYIVKASILNNKTKPSGIRLTIESISEKKNVDDNFANIAQLVSELSSMKNEHEVFDFLGTQLSQLLPKTIILINSSSLDGTSLTLNKILGLENSRILNLVSVLGFNPAGKSFKVAEVFKQQFSKPKLQLIKGSLYEFCNNEISETVSNLLSKALDLQSIHTIGIADQGIYYGFIHFFSTSKSEPLDKSFIESLVYLGFLNIARIKSIKDLEESENKYRILADNAKDVIFTLDLNLNYTYISPSVKSLRGYEPHELIGKSIFSIIPQDSYKRVQKKFTDEIEIAKKDRSKALVNSMMEFELLHRDGHRIWVEVKLSLIFDNNDKIAGILGVTRDITERKLTEKELVKKNTELKNAIAQKDKFFSILAHDLKSPFGHILNFTNLLVDEYDSFPEKKRRLFIELINKSSKQIYLLLENLLDWSRSQGGKIEFFPQKVNLDRIVIEVMELLSNSANTKKINLSKDIPSKLTLKADDYMLKTILRNLVGNAIKFTDKQGNVHISAAISGNEVIISITDNGVGMAQESIDSVFSLNNAYTKDGTEGEKGTGLGLLLCKEFIEIHGGKLSIKSKEGEGSVFSFSLPLDQKSKGSGKK